LLALPGIGDGMADHIQKILKTGDYRCAQNFSRNIPRLCWTFDAAIAGAQESGFLWKTFKAGTVEQVEQLARDGKLRDLTGFGEKSEQNILKAVEVFKKSAGRIPYWTWRKKRPK